MTKWKSKSVSQSMVILDGVLIVVAACRLGSCRPANEGCDGREDQRR